MAGRRVTVYWSAKLSCSRTEWANHRFVAKTFRAAPQNAVTTLRPIITLVQLCPHDDTMQQNDDTMSASLLLNALQAQTPLLRFVDNNINKLLYSLCGYVCYTSSAQTCFIDIWRTLVKNNTLMWQKWLILWKLWSKAMTLTLHLFVYDNALLRCIFELTISCTTNKYTYAAQPSWIGVGLRWTSRMLY